MELIKCLRAIKAHAFDVSDYPVVVTLEDHLTPQLQAKVAEVCVCVSLFCGSVMITLDLFYLFSLLC